jgi:hypothetical protein
VHDSIEDAQAALHLWQTFVALQKHGAPVFKRLLDKIYQIGRSIEWSVDKLDSSVAELLYDELALIKEK